MSTKLIFDMLEFSRMTLSAWKIRYGSATRISKDFSRIKKARVGIKIADAKTKLVLVHYRKGDWRDGEPKRVTIGNKPILCRLPGIKIGNEFLIIDGTHRLELGPSMVVIDYLELPRNERRYITDLFNPHWIRK